MIEVHFVDSDDHVFTAAEQSAIVETAERADRITRAHLPVADRLILQVESSPSVLEPAGDNAYAVSPTVIRWMVDPARDIKEVARSHLVKAFAHEAYHAARFRFFPTESGTQSWPVVALCEGLATVFARDAVDAHEPWSQYDPVTIADWATELFGAPYCDEAVVEWKFRHPDGRLFIAFRVGTWMADRVMNALDRSAAKLVRKSASHLLDALRRDGLAVPDVGTSDPGQ